MIEDYQLVNFQGQVIRDTAVERRRREELKSRRSGEPFTASTDCPDCGHLAVHWLAEPRLEPEWDDTPAGKAGIRIDRMINTMLWTGSRYDPPRTAVARVCVKCGYRWGQS